MILLVFVCSIVLCVSVFAVEAQACDDGCEAEAVHEEVAETASASGDCNHVNYHELERKDHWFASATYRGPAICECKYWVTYLCDDCDTVFANGSYYIENHNHVLGNHIHYINGVYRDCDYCNVCGYHSCDVTTLG